MSLKRYLLSDPTDSKTWINTSILALGSYLTIAKAVMSFGKRQSRQKARIILRMVSQLVGNTLKNFRFVRHRQEFGHFPRENKS